MASLTEIVTRAEALAISRNNDPHFGPVIDAGLTVEALFPHALRYAIGKDLKNGGNSRNYLRTHEIEFDVDGVGEFPDSALLDHTCHAYLTQRPRAAMVPYVDYHGQRYDHMLEYFSVDGSRILYSGNPTPLIRTEIAAAGSTSSDIVTFTDALFSTRDEGRRLRIKSNDGLVYADVFIETVDDNDTLYLRGRPAYGFAGQYNAEVMDSSNYVQHRALTNIETTVNSRTVICASGSFTEKDVGRRIRVVNSGVVLDAIIEHINSGTSVRVNANALSTTSVGTGSIMYSPVKLTAVSVPVIPANPDDPIDMLPKLAEDVIVIMAAALTAELKLPELLNYR